MKKRCCNKCYCTQWDFIAKSEGYEEAVEKYWRAVDVEEKRFRWFKENKGHMNDRKHMEVALFCYGNPVPLRKYSNKSQVLYDH